MECGGIDLSADTERSSSRYDSDRNALSQNLDVERRFNEGDSKLRRVALGFFGAMIKPTREHPDSSSEFSPKT